jgi:hypothetical protein
MQPGEPGRDGAARKLESLAGRFAATFELFASLEETDSHTPSLIEELSRLAREVLAQPVRDLKGLRLKAKVLSSAEGLIAPDMDLLQS